VSRDSRDLQAANRLPRPLATLFEKFKSFQDLHPQFKLKVRVKGDSEQSSNFYLRYETQLMFNPQRQMSAQKAKALGIVEVKPSAKKETKPDENEEGLISDAEAYQHSDSDFA
jgi:hypothetical protein